jgi:hypothetical protein
MARRNCAVCGRPMGDVRLAVRLARHGPGRQKEAFERYICASLTCITTYLEGLAKAIELEVHG